MKLIAFFILAACLHVNATGYGQKVTLSEREVHIEKIFTEIKKQTGFTFLYTSNILANTKRVSVKVTNATVNEVLDLALAGQGLEYRIKGEDRLIIIKTKPSVKDVVRIVQGGDEPIDEVRGVITDENGVPAQGVNVVVKGTNKGTTTNLRGEFILRDVNEGAVLQISSIGYDRQEILVKNKDFVRTQLKVAVGNLDEMQVIGYGTTSKRFSTGNVTTVKAADIERQPVQNPLLALQGRVPGMEIRQANGLAGAGVTVRIRGQNSISNGNDPLYIVDGVPYLSQMLPGLGGILGGSGGNSSSISGSPLSYINPTDIESIDVLKDADATAIYGTRGANGVVLITTKKGKAGPTRVDMNVQYGWGKVTKFIPWLNTSQYLEMRYEAYKNDGVDLTNLKPDASNYDLTVWDTTRYTDWNKELIGGTARYSNIQLSLNGGGNNVQYRIGYNYNKQTSVFPKSFGDPKGSLSFNLNSSSNNKRLNFNFSGNYQLDKNELPNYDASRFTNLAPNAPSLYNEDGTLNWASDPTTGYPTWNNPLADLNIRYRRKVKNLVTNAVLSYELINGLDIKINAGYTNMQSSEVVFAPSSAFAPIYLPFVERTSLFSNSENDSWTVEPQISYKVQIAKSSFSALVGMTILQNNSRGESITATKFNNDLVMEDMKAAGAVRIDNTIHAIYKYNAAFGRLNYNYSNKYLINLTARRDGTSRFGPNRQFANFGAVGVGWVFSEENFVGKNLNVINFGKLRASYGTTGSDQVGDYRFLNLYNYVNYNIPYQNSLSLGLSGLYNPDLAWEETKKFEAGLELEFWQGKVFVSSSYFKNRSSNQLTSYKLPTNTGAPSVPANLEATVQNTGWEFTLNTKNIIRKSFRWSTSVNLTISQNKLISLHPNVQFIDSRLIGQPLSTRFVYQYAGIDPVTGRYQFNDGNGGVTFRPDTAFDPVVGKRYSERPLNVNVRFFGGIQNNITWKTFELDFLFQFEKRLGESNQRGRHPGQFSESAQNQPIWVLDRWRKQDDNALVQRYNQNYSIYNSYNFLINSDAIWVDASFVRLKNVSLSWQIHEKLIKKMRLYNARVYTQAQNLLTITNYKGSDPETRSLTSLPPLRVWIVGLQLTL